MELDRDIKKHFSLRYESLHIIPLVVLYKVLKNYFFQSNIQIIRLIKIDSLDIKLKR